MALVRQGCCSLCCLVLLGACSNNNSVKRTQDANVGTAPASTAAVAGDPDGGHTAATGGDATYAMGGSGAGGAEAGTGGSGGSSSSTGEGGLASGGGNSGLSIGGGGAGGAETAAGGGSGVGGLRFSSGSVGGSPLSGCVPLVFQDLGQQEDPPLRCPIDTTLPECRSTDEGALVARSAACIEATKALRPCASLPGAVDFSTSEVVVVLEPYGGCLWPVDVDSVLDCEGEVRLSFRVREPCDSCDWPLRTARFISIPNSVKPVKATGKLIRVGEEKPCL